ncbi:exosortase-associated protein EpsI, B-type [Rhodoferax sp.]|uniref:exosortase-associated protein EpsI, B-type n=1 Tax=Rhodoferax sp. TaxID=50421 RepID=UPI00271B2C92|nr:exosortase-associated protein EpsI, B-type [Rhodoferax sp.]MDO9196982.1 EpsI family protein [Rhodoferax sp.]
MFAMNHLKSFGLCALMLFASYASVALTPQHLLSDTATPIDLVSAIPVAFGDWLVDPNVAPVRPSPEQQETLDQTYDQIVSRTYKNSQGARIMLSVAYGSAQTRKMRAHRQEVCYAAQGFEIKGLRQDNILVTGTEIPMTRMVAVQRSRVEPVTYWFTIGDSLVRSYLDRQIVQLKYAFSGFVPDGYLFRVSSISSDTDTAFSDQISFSSELLRSMDRRLAEKLIGKAPI